MTELLRANMAAEKLDLSIDRLYDYSRQGIVPVVKIGRQLRWNKEALDDFINQGGKSWSGGWRRTANRIRRKVGQWPPLFRNGRI